MIRCHFEKIIRITWILLLCSIFSGCSDSSDPPDISGYWEGEIENPATNRSWEFKLYIDQFAKEIQGVYTDFQGNISFRSGNYTGDDIGFVIDIFPEIVTFYGTVESDSYMQGSWSYSGDGNVGTWSLIKESGDYTEDEDNEGESETTSENPFTAQIMVRRDY